MISRRSVVAGLGAIIAAPVLVRASSLMPVRGIIMPVTDLSIMLTDPAGIWKFAPGSMIRVSGLPLPAPLTLPTGLIDGADYLVMCVRGNGQLELCGPYPSPAGREG